MIETETLTLASEAGRDFEAYLAQPDRDRGPGLIIPHDMLGANPVFRALADGLGIGGPPRGTAFGTPQRSHVKRTHVNRAGAAVAQGEARNERSTRQ